MLDSWWLKFKRAQQHLVDLRRMARLYAASNPYKVVRVRKSKRQDKTWQYRLVMDPPDPMFAMVIGDFVHNLRSALDHVVVACVPPRYRKSASWPVLHEDILARNPDGTFVHPDSQRRRELLKVIGGLSDDAFTFVIAMQPHRRSQPESDALGLLSRLENADKHRNLLAVGAGLENPVVKWMLSGEPFSVDRAPPGAFLKNNAILSHSAPPGYLDYIELKMDAEGTAAVHIQVTMLDRPDNVFTIALRPTLLAMLVHIRLILRGMERFAIRA